MKQYKITLNLSFQPEGCDDYDYDPEFDDEKPHAHHHHADGECHSIQAEDSDDEERAEAKEHREAIERTEEYFAKHGGVEKHVKENDAMCFVESLIYDGELVSAEWDKKDFKIHMIVNSDQTKEEIMEDLKDNSLEDGEYEACGDTGWIVMTRGPKGECFGAPWDMKHFWVYGLTDYRWNPIEIEEIGTKEETPDLKDLISITVKGREMYEKLKQQKKGPYFLSEQEEDTFRILRILMDDPALYGKRVIQ